MCIVVVLEGVNDYENLGLIFCNVVGLSVDVVVFGIGCVDLFYCCVVWVFMGYVLLVLYVCVVDWFIEFMMLKESGF